MHSIQILFATVVAITVASGAGAAALVVFGDARRNPGQRVVAERLAHIALIGAAALGSLLTAGAG